MVSQHYYRTNPLFHLCLCIPTSCRPKPPICSDWNFALSIRAYTEKPNSISSFANKLIGSLPVIRLLARNLNNEGGVGRDLIDFAEFRKRVGNKCASEDSRAFYEFQQHIGKRREKLSIDAPIIPMELRVEKALEGIYACCLMRGAIEEEDEMLLQVILTAVFPSVDKSEIKRIIKENVVRVSEEGEEEISPSERSRILV